MFVVCPCTSLLIVIFANGNYSIKKKRLIMLLIGLLIKHLTLFSLIPLDLHEIMGVFSKISYFSSG